MTLKTYYLVSDLHMGGDGQLQTCDYTDEFVAFLKELEQKDEEVELIIAGDTFGFWELTEIQGVTKLDEIIRQHAAIYQQMKRTGQKVKITLMVGNHDYDLACNPEFVTKLKAYNINLDTSLSLVREVNGQQLWIEHGQQADIFNASADYGNLYALPIGYFITETIVSGASRYSQFGQGNWLKDIRSVGTMQIPEWLISNYFYREMSWAIRWIVIPFMALFGLSFLALVAEILRLAGVTDVNIFLNNPFIQALGFVGNILRIIIGVNTIILIFMIIVSIPLVIVLRDVKRTLRRFQLLNKEQANYNVDSNEPYLRRARQVFAEHPEVAVYVFGHTHDAFLEQTESGQIIFNTGTWLKILHRQPVRVGYLPAVYVPTFRLNYFKVYEQDNQLVIDYVEVPKASPVELTWIQRLSIWRSAPPARKVIPARTTVARQLASPVKTEGTETVLQENNGMGQPGPAEAARELGVDLS
jgi:UDP-2,3-diacylglucosamine pyrophosphatase LpxH